MNSAEEQLHDSPVLDASVIESPLSVTVSVTVVPNGEEEKSTLAWPVGVPAKICMMMRYAVPASRATAAIQ